MPIDANSSVQSDGSTAGANSRQKRVMPSRSRRGGPGLGHCEVDILILETQKRKLENEPLIPGDTPFLLTTNPKYAEEALNNSESDIQINVVANDRYFDRPDVLKAFREQAVIQTPEYEAISESISGVGGRFRPRNQEEAMAETSDAAYEKRHRKFENFEKRQRFREKDKLRHEHYKLKERIDQLRVMEGASFMTLPASAFTPPPPQDIAEDVEETTSSPYVSLNGGVYFVEGERRRKEMLDVAVMLEERYTYLLPRKNAEASSSTLKDTESREGEETDTERDSGVSASKKDKAPKLRTQSVKSSASSTRAHSPASSRTLLSKKSWLNAPNLIPEPKRPVSYSRNRRSSFSTSTEPPDSILQVEEKERSSSPEIVVVDDIPEDDGLPSQPLPPPSPLAMVRSEESPSPVDDINEDDRLSQPLPLPPPLQTVRNEESPKLVDGIPVNGSLPSQLLPPPTALQLVPNEKSPSPVIAIVEEDNNLPAQPLPPVSPLQLDRNGIHSPGPPRENQFPLTIQNSPQPAEDVAMGTLDEIRPGDIDIEVEVSQPQPEPLLNMADHTQQMENLDEELEKPPSVTEEPILEPVKRRRRKRRGRPRKKVDTEEEPRTEEIIAGPVSTGELEQPLKKRRLGRPRKVLLPLPLPEIAVRQRMWEREDGAGPSRMMEEEPEVVSGIRLEDLPAEIGLSDSISTRPAKRHRKNREFEIMSVPGRAQTPPLVLDKGISTTSVCVRGQTCVSYVDSRTGETVITPSLLMVACMRAVEKTHSRRARHTTSFGAPTPDFGKGAIVDYELLEEILYRDFRDRSPEPSGSSVASDVTDEHEQEEHEEANPSDDDNGAEKGPADDETESESPEERLSNERDKPIGSAHGSSAQPMETSGQPMEVVEPQRDQNHRGVKLPEQGLYPRFGNRVLVYQGAYAEQLIASPEADPMPELPPGVRPREPSRRRHHCDSDDELIWD